MQIVTIGGYGFTEQRFVRALKSAEVDTFVDVRRRRGMRGAKYSFLNSSRLQALLSAANIRYVHALGLAPTPAIREVQKLEDEATGVAKSQRRHLSPSFVEQYSAEVLNTFDPTHLADELVDSKVVAIFCVETAHTACHRSLAAEHLSKLIGSADRVEHLSP